MRVPRKPIGANPGRRLAGVRIAVNLWQANLDVSLG